MAARQDLGSACEAGLEALAQRGVRLVGDPKDDGEAPLGPLAEAGGERPSRLFRLAAGDSEGVGQLRGQQEGCDHAGGGDRRPGYEHAPAPAQNEERPLLERRRVGRRELAAAHRASLREVEGHRFISSRMLVTPGRGGRPSPLETPTRRPRWPGGLPAGGSPATVRGRPGHSSGTAPSHKPRSGMAGSACRAAGRGRSGACPVPRWRPG